MTELPQLSGKGHQKNHSQENVISHMSSKGEQDHEIINVEETKMRWVVLWMAAVLFAISIFIGAAVYCLTRSIEAALFILPTLLFYRIVSHLFPVKGANLHLLVSLLQVLFKR